MDKQKTEYAIISNAVDILSVQCAGNREKIIDLLTGYLWDEEEAGGIKKSTGKFDLLDQLESGPWPTFVRDLKAAVGNPPFNRILDGMKERQDIISLYHWDCPFCRNINDYEDINCFNCGEFDRRLTD